MSLAVDYLKKINPKLPNFYAKRLTTLFEENSAQKNEKGGHEEHALRTAGEFSATVYYREGKEVEHAHGKQEQELITQGTFGPILSTVIVDMAHSWTQWARWEEGPNGPMAVFRFQVQQAESHYRTSMPTFLPLLDAMDPTAYHGEIGIDPTSGTILRLVLQADPDLGSTLQRADIMVEYGPVVIGEKSYTCPVRSVSIATAGEWFSSGRMTRLDDVVFNDYHVFRSEMRILP